MESSIIKTSIKNQKPVIGIRTPNYKYFRLLDNANKNTHLYDLKDDPLEDHNLAQSNKNKILEMEKILEELRHNALLQTESEKLSTEKEKELEDELKKLGYID